MNTGHYSGRARVLYVDDEEKSLKYFRMAFKQVYEVLTASDAEEGWRILEEHKGDIAVLLSDQRMPGKSGVDLLSKTRGVYPKIIRVLTTAYADLSSAIEGVNEGAIYQYIQKPWNIEALKATLKKATDFYMVEKERDGLLREKMSVLQRLIITDRVQSLGILSVGFSNRLNNPVKAFSNFIDQLPEDFLHEWKRQTLKETYEGWQSLGALAEKESRSLFDIASRVAERTFSSLGEPLRECALRELLLPASEAGNGNNPNPFPEPELIFEGEAVNGRINAFPEMLRECFKRLRNTLSTLWKDTPDLRIKLTVSSENGRSQFLKILFTAEEQLWKDADSLKLFGILTEDKEIEVSLDLLFAFYAIHHHGGHITIRYKAPFGPGFEIALPINPEFALNSEKEREPLNILLRHFEQWDAALL